VVELDADRAADRERPENESARRGARPKTPPTYVYVGFDGSAEGVSIPHRAVVRLRRRRTTFESSLETFFCSSPHSFDASTFEIWSALLNGARVAVAPRGSGRGGARRTTLARHGVTVLWLTAPLFQSNGGRWRGRRAGAATRSAGALGGGRRTVAGPRGGVRNARCRHGRIINGYGPTENTTFTCCWPVEAEPLGGGSVPIGRPIDTRACTYSMRTRAGAGGGDRQVYTVVTSRPRVPESPELTAERFVAEPTAGDCTAWATARVSRRRADRVPRSQPTIR